MELSSGFKFPTSKAQANDLMNEGVYLDPTGRGNPLREMVGAYFQIAYSGIPPEPEE